MKKITYLFILIAGLPAFMLAQCPGAPPAGYTCIPDVAFETRLIQLGIDNSDPSDLVDGLLDNIQAAAVTGDMILNNRSIVDFTGIEALVNISTLNINDNQITTPLNLSGNSLLTGVSALRCLATSIDLTGLTVLNELDLRENSLTTIDLSSNTALQILDLGKNALTELDLSNNLALTFVLCQRQSPNGFSPYNTLINIDLNGGDRSNLTTFLANFNASSECVYVDDLNAPYVGWLIDDFGSPNGADYCTGSLGTEDRTISSFSMYPNPTRNLVLVASRSEASKLDVYSIDGKLVLSKELSFGENNVNITSLSSGIYLARFSAENRSETKKLVIR